MMLDQPNYTLIAFVVFIIGCGFYLYIKRNKGEDDSALDEKKRNDELRWQIDLLKKDIENNNALHTQELSSKDNLIAEKERNFNSLIAEKDEQIKKISNEKQEQIENLKKERENIVEQLKDYLGKEFQNTSNKTLDNVSDSFRKQFENYFENKNKIASQNLEEMINPIEKLMSDLKNTNLNFIKSYKEDFTNFGSVLSDVKSTQEKAITETSKLTNALKGSSQSVGRWGEEKLKNILDMSGMTEGIDYEIQITTEDGLRPDCIINIPGERKIAIDSKISIQDYLNAMESNDEDARNIFLQKNALKIRNHMQSLSKKKYWEQIKGSLDQVVMFIPEESIYLSAMQHDRKLFQDSFSSKVVIVGPSNLLVIIRLVVNMLGMQKQSKDISKIIEIGSELLRRIQTMTAHITGLGENIQKTSSSYNKFIGSLDTKFFPKVEELSNFNPSIENKNKKLPKHVDDNTRQSSKLIETEDE
jgi:DNA recombination protein RmuC